MRGFSLVELSIVLVILGLLTGGILAGQSLIRASELRAGSTEYQRYIAAVNTFRDKYFAIPGDFKDGTRFWGRLNSNPDCVTNSSATVATPGTCDGNGDAFMNAPVAASQSGEIFQIWRELANAGLIEGSYTGLSGSAGAAQSIFGTNVPASKMNSGGWYISTCNNCAGDTVSYALDYGNYIGIGGVTATSVPQSHSILKPEEAWNIDTKLDDGRPAYGKVIARNWNNACATGGATNADLANSVYNLSNTTMNCALYFVRQF